MWFIRLVASYSGRSSQKTSNENWFNHHRSVISKIVIIIAVKAILWLTFYYYVTFPSQFQFFFSLFALGTSKKKMETEGNTRDSENGTEYYSTLLFYQAILVGMIPHDFWDTKQNIWSSSIEIFLFNRFLSFSRRINIPSETHVTIMKKVLSAHHLKQVGRYNGEKLKSHRFIRLPLIKSIELQQKPEIKWPNSYIVQ